MYEDQAGFGVVSAVGSRLRRLSDRWERQVRELYEERSLPFEPRWFPILQLLSRNGRMAVGELAERIGITHAAVSQVRSELVRRGLVRAKKDPKDGRRQFLELTSKGQAMCEQFEPVFRAITSATDSLCAKEVSGLLPKLARLEAALETMPINVRARRILSRRKKTARTRLA